MVNVDSESSRTVMFAAGRQVCDGTAAVTASQNSKGLAMWRAPLRLAMKRCDTDIEWKSFADWNLETLRYNIAFLTVGKNSLTTRWG